MKTESKKHGGHQTGLRKLKNSVGKGPVYIVRAALDKKDKSEGGNGYSAKRFADLVGCGLRTIERCEANGTWPRNRAVQSNIRGYAEEIEVDLSQWPLPDEGGVFL